MTIQPLNGVQVIALEQAVAAPLATRHLGNLGATVIKIERPRVGDFARHYDQTVNVSMANYNFSRENRRLRDLAPDSDLPYSVSPGRI